MSAEASGNTGQKMPSPAETSGRLAVGFSCLGHFFVHFFEPTFFVVALVLPTVLGISYEAVLALVVVGKILLGLAAPLAGWLGDRWGATRLMLIYFLGLGAAGIACGLSSTSWELGVALTALGLFGSIYHPVGIAWLVRTAQSQGKALGVNGIFGSLGPAVAGVVAGALTEWVSWRAAFLVPGVLAVATGVVFWLSLRKGWVVNGETRARAVMATQKGDTVRAFMVLALGMLVGGLVYQSTQAALPKVFDDRLFGFLGGGTVGPGTAVMLVYGFSACFQLVAGHLADRFSLKWVYLLAWLVQGPLLATAAWATGAPLVGVAMLMVTFNTSTLPAENMLLARYTPEKWRGTAYGLKFVLNFGMAALAVPAVGMVRAATGDLAALFVVLAALAAMVALAAFALPGFSKDRDGRGQMGTVKVGRS